jgi:hypothetical protein
LKHSFVTPFFFFVLSSLLEAQSTVFSMLFVANKKQQLNAKMLKGENAFKEM